MLSSVILLALGLLSAESQIAAPTDDSDFASPPVPLGNPRDWLNVVDFPTSAPEGEEAFVRYTLSIDEQGRVTRCSGRDSMRQSVEQQETSVYITYTCKLIGERARFRPARNSSGDAIAGAFEGIGRWSRTADRNGRMTTRPIPRLIAPSDSQDRGASATAAESTAPASEGTQPVAPPIPLTDPNTWIAGYPMRARRLGVEGEVSVILTVGSDGRVTSCRLDSSSGHDILNEWTCGQLLRHARFEPADDNGAWHGHRTYPYRHVWSLDQPDASPVWPVKPTPG